MTELTKAQLDGICRIMEASFPTDERRPREEQARLFDNPVFHAYGMLDDKGEVMAFLTVYEFDTFVFAEHLAVDEKFRNQGLGATLMRGFLETLGKPLCLEVEHPTGELPRRRIGFYERLGFTLNDYPYIQPPMSEGQGEVPLLVMSTRGPLTPEQFETVKKTLYREVYHASI